MSHLVTFRVEVPAYSRTQKSPRRDGGGSSRANQAQMALTSSGMPGPNVVDTAPFWM